MKHLCLGILLAITFLGLTASPAQTPAPTSSDQELLALVKEVQEQQAQISANQKKIDGKLAELAETIRTARLFPPSKSYDDMEPPRGESMEEGGLLSNPNILLTDAGMAISALGKLEIEGHSCLKIEASRKDQPEKIYLYAARDLKNLIIVTQIIGPEKSTIAG